MKFTWMLDEDLGTNFPHVKKEDEVCQTKATNEAGMDAGFNVPFTTGIKPCLFPFRYKDILYYACTNITEGSVCATETDSDFNAKTLGECDIVDRCPIQGQSDGSTVSNYSHGTFQSSERRRRPT